MNEYLRDFGALYGKDVDREINMRRFYVGWFRRGRGMNEEQMRLLRERAELIGWKVSMGGKGGGESDEWEGSIGGLVASQ